MFFICIEGFENKQTCIHDFCSMAINCFSISEIFFRCQLLNRNAEK